MPNNFVEERKSIEGKFNTDFDNTLVPVQYDNVAKLLQGSNLIDQDDVGEWVRLSIQSIDNTPTALGNVCRQDRITGQIIVSVFVRENIGSNRAREIADQIYPIFNRVEFDGITTRNSVVTPLPPLNGWYQIALSTEYFWDLCL